MVFTFYNDPSVQKHYLSYDAALILVVIVLLLLVASRIVVARTQRHSESARTAPARHLRPLPQRSHAGGRDRPRATSTAPGSSGSPGDLTRHTT